MQDKVNENEQLNYKLRTLAQTKNLEYINKIKTIEDENMILKKRNGEFENKVIMMSQEIERLN